MTTFDKRKDAFENKFAHDAEMRFKATARRNKLLGLWAAGLMNLGKLEADAYAKAVVQADFELPGDDDVFNKVKADLAAAKVTVSDHDLRRRMDELLAEAMEQVASES